MNDSPIEATEDELPWAHDGWRVQRKEGLGLSLVLTYRFHGQPLYGPKRIWHSETKTATAAAPGAPMPENTVA